jgi:hypothetical protein
MSAVLKPSQRYRRRHTVTVELDMDDIDDETLKEEYDSRFGGNSTLDPQEARRQVERIRTLMLCGQDASALAAMREYTRDLLGTAL